MMNGENITPCRNIMIAGEPIKVKIDMPAMYDIEQQIEMLKVGISKKSIFQLADPNYDIREMSIILMNGIKGAYRFEKSNEKITMEEAGNLLQKHFNYIRNNMKNPNDVTEFTTAINNLMVELSNAVRESIGFSETKM